MAKNCKSPAYYGLVLGKKSGVYSSWKQCEHAIKSFSSKARVKRFKTLAEAEGFVRKNQDSTKMTMTVNEAETTGIKKPRILKPPKVGEAKKPADSGNKKKA